MSNLVLLKRSAVASKVPATTDLLLGEIALNTYDGKVFMKKNNGVDGIVEVGAVTTVAGRTGAIVLANTDVGLGNVENKSSATIRSELTSGNVTTALGYTPANAATYGAANGVATLDGNGKIVTSQLPAITITDTFVVASEAAMLALNVQTGDIAVRTDLNKSFIVAGVDGSVIGNWQELLTPSDVVQSVNGKSGAVTLSTTDILEGTNQYFTNARARAAISATGSLAYNSATGVISYTAPTSGTGSGDFKSDGSVAMTGQIVIAAGSPTAPSIRSGSSANTGMWTSAGNTDIGFTVGGSNKFNVGVNFNTQSVAMFHALAGDRASTVFNGNMSGFAAMGSDTVGNRLWFGTVTDQTGATISSRAMTIDLVTGIANFTSSPTVPTQVTSDNSTKVATTAFVKSLGFVTATTAPVTTVAGKSGAVTLTASDVSGVARSGANSDITSLTGLTTALAVGQGGTGVTTSTGSNANVLQNSPTLTGTALATNLTASGTLTSGNLVVSGAAGAFRTLWWNSAANGRFNLHVDNTAETGSDAGSNMNLVAISDAGVQTVVYSVARSAKVVDFKFTPTLNGVSLITAAGAPVQSVAGRTGAVVLSMSDISGTVDGGSF